MSQNPLLSGVMKPVLKIVSRVLLGGFLVFGLQVGTKARAGFADSATLITGFSVAEEVAKAIAEKIALGIAEELLLDDELEPEFKILKDAIEAGDITALKAAYSPEMDVSKPRGQFQAPPLIWAVTIRNRSADIVQFLLDHGADVMQTDKRGYTALHHFAGMTHSEDQTGMPVKIVVALVAFGADIEARTDYGTTPIEMAIYEDLDVAEALLLNGANPGVHTSMNAYHEADRGLALVMAVGMRSERVKLLLAYGADPAIKSLSGQTTLDYYDNRVAKANARVQELRDMGAEYEFDLEYALDDVKEFAASRELIKQALATKD